MSGPPVLLDHIARRVIQRLEGARRTWATDPVAARVGLALVAEGALECELASLPSLAGARRASVEAAFRARLLPRYLDLAVRRNGEEGRQAVRSRRVVLGTGVLLLAALVIVLVVNHPASVLPLVAVLGVPLSAEARLRDERARYERLLEALADDMKAVVVPERLHGSYELATPTPRRASPMVVGSGL